MRTIGVLALALLLGGCTYFNLIDATRVPLGAYSVEPQTAWSARSTGKVDAWTVDGYPLQSVRFVKGIEDGQVIEGIATQAKTATLPKFKKGMNPIEIMELFVDSMTTAGLKVEARNLSPTPFGGAEGFRFEYSYLLPNGLEEEGFAVGAVLKNQLHLITYSGARGYYYTKHKDQAERMVQSIRLQ